MPSCSVRCAGGSSPARRQARRQSARSSTARQGTPARRSTSGSASATSSPAANYRSAVVQGRARRVVDPDERLTALRALVDHLAGAGRADATQTPTRKELAATAVVAVGLDEASVKVRSGPPGDGDAVAAGDLRWAGEVPVHTVLGTPRPCPSLPGDVEIPEHVSRLVAGR